MVSLKKSIAGLTIAAFVFAGFATPAKAQTVAELQALINQLMAQIAAMSGGSSTASSCTTFGLPGVMGIQQAVNQLGYAPALVADGKFGMKTKAGVMWAQSKLGVTADGAWGAKTNAAYMAWLANCSGGPSTGPSTDTSSLDGSYGTIANIQTLTQYSNEEVGEGEDDVKIAGFEIEASNDGDIKIDSVKLRFDPTGNAGSNRMDRYMDSVTIWMGDKKVGESDAEDFTENSNDTYTRTIALNNAVVRADKKVKFYVSVDANNNLDSGDISTTNDNWTVAIDNVRFMDGSGVVTTLSDSTIPSDLDWDSLGDGIAMNFVDFGTSADTDFRISKDSDSPAAGIVIVDDANGKDNILLLSGKFRVDGNSDVLLDEMPVTFTVSSGLLGDMASNLILKIDGEEYTESSTTTSGTSTSATVTFDNLDFDISAGDSVDYEILADINGTDDFAEGVSLTASITSDNRSAVDLENEEGDQVSDSDKSGTAVGEAQEFRSEGVSVTLVGTPTAATNADATLGTYTIKFKVEAVGDDAYVGTTSSKYTYALQEASSGATTGGVSAAITNLGGSGNSTSTTTGGNWKVNSDTSVTLELQVFRSDLAGGAYRAVMSAIGWDSTDDDAVMSNSYTSNMDDFKTSYIQLI